MASLGFFPPKQAPMNAATFDGQPSGFYRNASNINAGTLAISYGGTGVTSTPTNGQLLIGTGSGFSLATLTGTTDQVSITNASGAITLSLPQALATTSTPTFGGMTVNGTMGVTGDLTVSGNLTVNGTSTIVNSTSLTLDDPIITLGGDTAPTVDDNKDRGVEFRWHTGSAAKVGFFGFDDSTGKFIFIPDATNSSEVFSGTSGTIAANFEGPLDGNAASATKLATARTVGLTGDVTGSASFDGTDNVSITASIPAASVGFSKLENVASEILVGRTSAGSGSLQALTAAQVRTLLNVADGATANLGTVTSVGVSAPSIFNVTSSPITTSGTISLSLVNQASNYVWAGPSVGLTSGAPSFRLLVSDDIPGLTSGKVTDFATAARDVLAAGTGVAYDKSTGTFSIGQNVGTTASVTFGNVTHSGLVATAGTNVDQVKEFQVSLTLTTAWQDTTVNATDLATGTYAVQVYANDSSVGGGHVTEFYSGVMSWFANDTDEVVADEIALHRAGRATGGGVLFLRIQRTLSADSDDLKLQISGNTSNLEASTYTFKFRRLI